MMHVVTFGNVNAVYREHPLVFRGFHAFHLSLLRALTGMGICPG